MCIYVQDKETEREREREREIFKVAPTTERVATETLRPRLWKVAPLVEQALSSPRVVLGLQHGSYAWMLRGLSRWGHFGGYGDWHTGYIGGRGGTIGRFNESTEHPGIKSSVRARMI